MVFAIGRRQQQRLLKGQGLDVCTEQATGFACSGGQKLLSVLGSWQHLLDMA